MSLSILEESEITDPLDAVSNKEQEFLQLAIKSGTLFCPILISSGISTVSFFPWTFNVNS